VLAHLNSILGAHCHNVNSVVAASAGPSLLRCHLLRACRCARLKRTSAGNSQPLIAVLRLLWRPLRPKEVFGQQAGHVHSTHGKLRVEVCLRAPLAVLPQQSQSSGTRDPRTSVPDYSCLSLNRLCSLDWTKRIVGEANVSLITWCELCLHGVCYSVSPPA
jgi:hypothetical protein